MSDATRRPDATGRRAPGAATRTLRSRRRRTTARAQPPGETAAADSAAMTWLTALLSRGQRSSSKTDGLTLR
jgi:hypothetical protein